MSEVIKGALSALTGTRRSYSPSNGYVTTFMYQFAKQSDAQAFFASAVSSGYQATIDDKGPVYTVEYSDPTPADGSGEVPVDLWEMPPISQDVSIFQLAEFQALPEADRLKLRTYNQSYPETKPTLTSDDGESIFKLLQNGTDHYQSPTVSVRWTRTVSGSWNSLGGTYTDVGKIWYASSIINLGAPGLIAAAITAATSQRAAAKPAPTNYRTGWLKQQPTITQRGANKFDIVQEWMLETWSVFLYGLPA